MIVNWIVFFQEQRSIGRATRVGIACTIAVLLLPFWGILFPIVLLDFMNVSSGLEPFATTSWLFAGSLVILGAGPIFSFKEFDIPARMRLASMYNILGAICVYFTDKLASEAISR